MFGRQIKKHNTRDFWQKGEKLIRKGKKNEAEEIFLSLAESPSPLDRHYAYIKLVRLYSNLPIITDAQREKLIEICEKDIALFPEFYEAWMLEYQNNVPTPYFPSFSVLADIYEQLQRLDEAVSICELALGYGLTETVGEDFATMLERLYAKRNRTDT